MNILDKKTDYGTAFKDIAEFILGFCSMGLSAELSEKEHILEICKALDSAPETLLFYLSDATENNKLLHVYSKKTER